jgi:hypothetical protein
VLKKKTSEVTIIPENVTVLLLHLTASDKLVIFIIVTSSAMRAVEVMKQTLRHKTERKLNFYEKAI